MRGASNEWIAGQSWRAAAHGIVINHVTDCPEAAGAWTRVYALLIAASLGQRAIRAHGALGPASGRYAHESCYAGADWLLVHLSANAVRTTGRRRTGVPLYGICISMGRRFRILIEFDGSSNKNFRISSRSTVHLNIRFMYRMQLNSLRFEM